MESTVDTLHNKVTRSDQAKLGLYANNFFQTVDNLYQERVIGKELVCRMASKWEK